MRKLIMPIASLGLATALTGCNSTDVLIPQVDVGAGNFRSPPVTQSDLDTMSTQTAIVPVQTVPPSSTAAFSAQPNISSPPTQYATGDATYTDPAGTLDAQANRLAEGTVPIQSRQAQTVQDEAEQGETGPDETGQDEVGQVEVRKVQTTRIQSPAPQQEPAPQQSATEPAASAPQQEVDQTAALPAASGSGGIRFLPIIGAPVEAVTPLSKQLGADARAQGLAIKGSADKTSEHILKGYFSALNDGGKTTVVYVWDILDGSGNRLHRIQGQDTVGSTAAEPWSAVPPETMQAIATKTIKAYLDWRQSRAG
ncbi:hypothetical protein [Sinorhizobium terangae]|uniref:Lipoprotein n=1 Tax=Sinorhizobium terangae TaxID=110322 RepID=A0A6N7LKZ6_SINTE|nr:hypothetical protein [Sinorhizobium terangae]MBB4185351.1 hypothetical protein [Sinorhizobium terangae]MQX17414.1 hypothetical protein [Sinorhizobium terangae]WFU46571.1 hypothetical protein QA637_11745 [Sinorhizobium terangae]